MYRLTSCSTGCMKTGLLPFASWIPLKLTSSRLISMRPHFVPLVASPWPSPQVCKRSGVRQAWLSQLPQLLVCDLIQSDQMELIRGY